MIPVLSAAQMREVDACTIQHTPIPSIELMERAATACVAWLDHRYPVASARSFTVVCGPGNNGGDGLAIARLLYQRGHAVRTILCSGGREPSPDAAANLTRLRACAVPVLEVMDGSGLPDFSDGEVVVDALFGTGLDRPLAGPQKQCVVAMNRSRARRISIDMPSGLFAGDNDRNDADAIVQADVVLTFQCPKLALLLPENEHFVGQLEVLDIGLLPACMEAAAPVDHLLELRDVRPFLPVRGRFMHKGRAGHALVLAGGPGRMGAAILAGRAAARSGAGLISLMVPSDLQLVVHQTLPEAMCAGPDAKLDAFSAVGIGPALGVDKESAALLERVLRTARSPLVIDADALTLLARSPALLDIVPSGSILTPHPLELERLVGGCASGFERLAKARALAQERSLIVVLKGAFSAICAPDGSVRFNPTGNPGMAKGGAGDALTGVITALLAQGANPLEAACAGVYAHGLAGDLAAAERGQQGMLVSDLIEQLPMGWQRIGAAGQ